MIKNEPMHHLIHLDTWARKPYFDHYYQQVKCTYSITADLDIASLLILCKKKSIKLYTALIHMLTTVVNQMDELRTTFNEQGQLGIWDYMSPSYTTFHDDDKSFSNIWTPYHQDFSIFNRDFLEDIEKYGNIHAFIAKDNAPSNLFPVSCIPWVSFTGFNLNIYNDAQYLSPIFTIGKYYRRDNKTFIPISVQLHHALCDGYQAGMIFERLQTLATTPEHWIRHEWI